MLLDMDNTHVIHVGDFITVPAWSVFGQAIATRPATLGSEQSQEVLIERKPDDPHPRWYRLEPWQFSFED